MSRRGLLLASLALAVVAFAPVPSAGADVFGKAQIASTGFLPAEGRPPELQQALYAHDPAISGNAEYVAFDGYFGGRTGVWRRNLHTGEVQPVAVGLQQEGSEACVSHEPCEAVQPSISESGQYVSFTSAAPLSEDDQDEDGKDDHPNVYVRNMAVPESSPSAYALVSAVNGKSEGLTYEGSSAYGAVAAGRSAMSSNGEQVVFVTTALSNLAACETGAPIQAGCEQGSSEAPAPNTPALQVAVRNLVTKETRLVSVEYDPETGQPIPDKPVSAEEGGQTYGAVYSPVVGAPEFPRDYLSRAYRLPLAVGASISPDGNAVAWMGSVVYKQARMLPDETKASYAEPLWRLISNPAAATRRVSGGSEPESPACSASGQLFVDLSTPSSDPCQGPFAVEPEYGLWDTTSGEVVPELSADGETVAFLANAQLESLGVDFGRSAGSTLDDLYVVKMRGGLTRTEALQPLTQLVPGGEGGSAPIVDLAVSPDGSQVAFTTQRIEFPLGSPGYVSEPAAVQGLAELFDVDLTDDTLTRVTVGYEGGPTEHPHIRVRSTGSEYETVTDGALSPSFSGNGDTLAFSSTASNLVYGDGNTPPPVVGQASGSGSADGGNVYYVSRELFPPEVPESYISSAPAGPSVTPAWSLSVTARSLANGDVRLYVEVPGSGKLSAAAASSVLVTADSHTARKGKGGARSKSARIHRRVVTRDVAKTQRTLAPSTSAFVELTLALAPAYRALATRSGGLSASVSLLFSAPGEPTLKHTIAVSFRRTVKASSKKASRASARSRKDRHRR